MTSTRASNTFTLTLPNPFRGTLNTLIFAANLTLVLAIGFKPVHDAVEGSFNLYQGLSFLTAWISPPPAPQLDKDQNSNVDAIIRAGKDLNMSPRDIQIAIMTAQQESSLQNKQHGDDWYFQKMGWGNSDSLGLFQQRPQHGSLASLSPGESTKCRQDPYCAAKVYFEDLKGVSDRNNMEPWQVAAKIQRPAKEYERHYQQWEGMSKAIVDARGVSSPMQLPNFLAWILPSSSQDKGFIQPVEGTITSPYGMRIHPITGVNKLHKGIDFGAIENAPTRATKSGTVIFAGDKNDGYGIRVEIKHEGGYESLYAHLNQSLVQTGDRVSQGQEIGKSGSTGMSTGVHSHFEIRLNGELVDPQTLLGGQSKGSVE